MKTADIYKHSFQNCAFECANVLCAYYCVRHVKLKYLVNIELVVVEHIFFHYSNLCYNVYRCHWPFRSRMCLFHTYRLTFHMCHFFCGTAQTELNWNCITVNDICINTEMMCTVWYFCWMLRWEAFDLFVCAS